MGGPLRLWTLPLVFALASCSRAGRERPGTAPDASARPEAAAPPAPPPLQLTLRYEASDGGLVPVAAEPGGRAFLEPTQALQLSSNLPLRNWRLRLFDEADRAMVSDDEVLAT